MALFGGRTVLVTVTKVDDKTIRASVIPPLAKTEENPALTPRITFTGPPNGLGAEPTRHLAGYPPSPQANRQHLCRRQSRYGGCGPLSHHVLCDLCGQPAFAMGCRARAATPALAAGCSSFTSNLQLLGRRELTRLFRRQLLGKS